MAIIADGGLPGTALPAGSGAQPATIETVVGTVEQAVTAAGGTVITALDGGLIATFDVPDDALETALAMQRANATSSAGLRIGAHAGSGRVDGEEPAADLRAVEQIARRAGPGEVVVSDAARSLAPPHAAWRWSDLGSTSVAELDGPVRLHRLHDGRLRLDLLGDPDVHIAAQRVEGLSGRALSLLAYLVIHRASAQDRQTVAFRFWPDSTETQARTNLRQLLLRLRRALPDGDRLLAIDDDTIGWRGGPGVVVDVIEFESAAGTGVTTGDARALARAASLYRGDLLSTRYEEWVLEERERLRGRALEVLDRLMAVAEAEGDTPAAISHGERLVRLDPYRESAYRRLMRVHAGTGERARALRTYHGCASLLVRELGVEPDRETVDLYEAIRDAPTGIQQRSGGGPPSATRLPLLGRDEEWELLLARWGEAFEGGGRLIVVSGEAGIGKSRLVEELRRWCVQLGVSTAATRAYEAEGRLAYAPVVDVLRSPAVRPHLRHLDPVWANELTHLLPELGAETALSTDALAYAGRPDELGGRGRLFEATARAVTADGRPLLIVLDDLQWCDAATAELLHFVLRSDRSARIVVVATARPEDLGTEPRLATALAQMRSDGTLSELSLGRLSDPDARALALAAADGTVADLDGLVRDAEGNPLFLVEMARAGAGLGGDATLGAQGSAVALPPRVQAMIDGRLDRLSAPAHELVGLVAVIGREFTFELVAHASGGDPDALVDALDELWRRDIVHQRHEGSYDFTHDKIREVAHARVGPIRRERMHLEIAKALEAVHHGDPSSVAAQLAAHHARSGSADLAIAWYQAAIEGARRVFADDEVISLARLALDLIPQLPPTEERDDRERALLVAMGVALFAARGSSDETYAVYRRAKALADERGRALDPPTLRVMGNLAIVRRDHLEARDLGEILLRHGDEHGDAISRVEGAYLIGAASCWLGELARSRAYFERAIAAYRPERSRRHLELFVQEPWPVCQVRLAHLLWHFGDAEGALALGDEALAFAEDLAHPYTLVYVVVMAAWTAVEADDLDRADRLIERLETLPSSNLWARGMRAALVGAVCARRGDPAAAAARLADAVELIRATDQLMAEPIALVWLAEAQVWSGVPAAGLEPLAAADVISERGMRYGESELHRIRAEILGRLGGDPTAIDRTYRRAVDVARAQPSVSLELRALASRARWLTEAHRDAGGVLADLRAAHDRCSHGRETRDLLAARALLDPHPPSSV